MSNRFELSLEAEDTLRQLSLLTGGKPVEELLSIAIGLYALVVQAKQANKDIIIIDDKGVAQEIQLSVFDHILK